MEKLADISAFERLGGFGTASDMSVFNSEPYTKRILKEFRYDTRVYGVDKKTYDSDKLADDIGLCVGLVMAGSSKMSAMEDAQAEGVIKRECVDAIDAMEAKKLIRFGKSPKGSDTGEVIAKTPEFIQRVTDSAMDTFRKFKNFR